MDIRRRQSVTLSNFLWEAPNRSNSPSDWRWKALWNSTVFVFIGFWAELQHLVFIYIVCFDIYGFTSVVWGFIYSQLHDHVTFYPSFISLRCVMNRKSSVFSLLCFPPVVLRLFCPLFTLRSSDLFPLQKFVFLCFTLNVSQAQESTCKSQDV